MPFFIVQLANYKQEDKQSKDSKWAELRESQMKVTQLENVDMVTAIDIGNANDIHPYNKKEVGRRLSLLAKHYVYNGDLTKGPSYKSNIKSGKSITIQFETYASELKSLDKYGYLRGFAIAGDDGVFKWAKAKIIAKNKIKVYRKDIPNPMYVRYAWSDNPGKLDLVNTEELPAFPFRTDNFELNTTKNKYSYDPHAF